MTPDVLEADAAYLDQRAETWPAGLEEHKRHRAMALRLRMAAAVWRSLPAVDTGADAVEIMLGKLHGQPEAQAMLRAMKRERGELRQRVLEAEKAARVTLEQAERAGPCFKSILLREALTQVTAERDEARRQWQNYESVAVDRHNDRELLVRDAWRQIWALVRAAGGKIVVERHHMQDADRGVLHRHEEPTRAVVFRATVEGEPPA